MADHRAQDVDGTPLAVGDVVMILDPGSNHQKCEIKSIKDIHRYGPDLGKSLLFFTCGSSYPRCGFRVRKVS